MSQVFVKPEDFSADHFSVQGPEARHVVRVLRRDVGDRVEIFDGAGHRFEGVLTTIDPTGPRADGKILRRIETTPSHVILNLFQGLPRGAKFDYVLEKSTELGVDSIVPFLSEKSLIRLDNKQSDSKLLRWKKILQAAAKQCNRSDIPQIQAPRQLPDFSSQLQSGFALLFDGGEGSLSLREVMDDIFPTLPRPNSSNRRRAEEVAGSTPVVINLIVGPESGFGRQELEWLVGLGARKVSLGSNTLRTETAGLAALAIVKYEMGLL